MYLKFKSVLKLKIVHGFIKILTSKAHKKISRLYYIIFSSFVSISIL